MNPAAIPAWLTIHRELLAMENSFTDLAMAVANGTGDAQELKRRREVLEATRLLCKEAYERAFPEGSAGAPKRQ